MKRKNDNNNHSYIFTRETLGMTILLFSALLVLILLTYNTVFSSLGAAVCAFMYGTFGYASYLAVAALACLGVWLVFEKKPAFRPSVAVFVGLTIAMFFMLFHAVATRDFNMENYGAYLGQCYTAAEAGYAGYTFGGALAGLVVYPVARGITFTGAYVVFSVLMLLFGYVSYLVIRREKIARGEASPRAKRTKGAKQGENVQQVPQSGYAPEGGYGTVNAYYPVQDGTQAAQPYAPLPADYAQPVQQPAQPVPQPAQPQYFAYQPEPLSPYYQQPEPQPERDDHRFSPENLGRKILFENGEFAAESYRRNMIFNDDSYFNHPVHNEGDYLSSFSLGGKSKAKPQQPQVQGYNQSYTQSYSDDVEKRESKPSAPSYIYGDKPADNLDAYVPDSDYGDEDDYDSSAEEYGGDDYSSGMYGYEEDYDSPVQPEKSSFVRPEQDNSRRGSGDISRPVFGQPENGSQADFTRLPQQPPRDYDRPAEREDASAAVRPPENFSRGLDRDFGQVTPPTGEIRRGETQQLNSETNPASANDGQFMRRTDSSEEIVRNTEERPSVPHVPENDRLARTDEPVVRMPDRAVEEGAADNSDKENEQQAPAPQTQPKQGRNNDLRSIFSPSNSNISDEVKPDVSRLPSVREDRENLFDSDDDDYLDDAPDPDLGVAGLRNPSVEPSSGLSRTPQPRESAAQPPQSRPVQAERTPAPAPEKPKHVWKKYVRPTLDLLADYPEDNNANRSEIEENKALIIETLENFRIGAHISEVTIGPAITRYDVIIEDRTNIKSAMRYREAIAMALMKENVTAYLNYSKGAISIEVPNGHRTVVGLKTMIRSSQFVNCKPNTLTFALGKDVEGKPICPDITKMPHLLVAGTTGSGKSVCLSALIISLLYKYGPDELRFILVDPKQSEFISYENLPHLIINEIISDVDKAIKALNWAIKEMERRYTLFKEMTLSGTLVKNLNEYNAHLPEGEEKLPKIVIILDEFGDLMLQSKKDVESRIIRLVQKSRACGIHLILATQRPSVDCITGLIKSNLPTRIGFKVNSFDDSRTIFDIGGAEKLLGAGDMYYRSAQNPDLMRIQCCLIESEEVQAVTDFVKKNNETYFDQSVSDFINTVEEPDDGGNADSVEGDGKIDDKYIQALKFCVTSNQASVSMLQRRFPIGYVKACKIIDWMENMNYITQSEGSKPRKVLLSLDEFTRIYGDVDD